MKLNLLPLLLNKEDRQTLTTQLTFADHQYDNYNQWFRPSTSTLAINAGREGEASQDYSKSAIRTLEWITNYANSFGNHNIKAMAGYSYQYERYSGLNAANKDFPNDALEDNTSVAVLTLRMKGSSVWGPIRMTPSSSPSSVV